MNDDDRSSRVAEAPPEVILIAAVGPGRVIGDGLRLPWSLPRDMRLFRRLTTGHAVVMGRKTFESLRSRPLPKRRNIVVSRNPGLVAPGCTVAHSMAEAIAAARPERRVFVIGGGEVYRQALPFATGVLLTDIFDDSANRNLFDAFRGDVYFPRLEPSAWQEVPAGRRSYVAASSLRAAREAQRHGMRFRVRRFVRAGAETPRFPRLTGREVEAALATARPAADDGAGVRQADLFGAAGAMAEATRRSA